MQLLEAKLLAANEKNISKESCQLSRRARHETVAKAAIELLF
jgi:hypothetical protein